MRHLKLMVVTMFAAALAVAACGGEYDADEAALQGCVDAPAGYCESVMGGECYDGKWVTREGECLCHRTKGQCAQACGMYPVSNWSPFVCTCNVF